ncbi:MAG: hypothetical protein DRQ88_10800 [Epsilonproteobacteria bacterium]|nr:MAG: hypothetical protein DRQ88_10800 [Campylobacterota bacterium]RLA65775.1 MAG: hypothetical protein DRQ89_00025 [Campylobacterota bacterium]
MKILLILILLPTTLWGSNLKKIISGFNVVRPITLIHQKNFETIKKGVYRIILQQDKDHIILWFEQLDKAFKFKLPKGKSLSENFTLSSDISGQPFNLVVFSKTKKHKIREYIEDVENSCRIDGKGKIEEECHPKLEWVPFQYRKLVKKKGPMFCYLTPQLVGKWGKRRDKIAVTVFGRTATIDLVDPRKSEIVAAAQYRDEQTQKKVQKKGQCR